MQRGFGFLEGCVQVFSKVLVPLVLGKTRFVEADAVVKEHLFQSQVARARAGGEGAVFCGQVISFPVCAAGLPGPPRACWEAHSGGS